VGGGGDDVLSLDPPPEKIQALTPLNFFLAKNGKIWRKNGIFKKMFWPTIEIFTNLL
jgi:hypothetical protein